MISCSVFHCLAMENGRLVTASGTDMGTQVFI
jgi:hypothetical protein